MKSTAHAAISLVVGLAAVVVAPPPIPAPAVVGLAVAVGVGIDFDHFLLARYNTGHWGAARRCLRDPRIVFLDQDAIFEAGDVGSLNRLLTHVVIGGIAVPLAYAWIPYVGAIVAVALYAHLLADLVAAARTSVVVERSSLDAERSADGGRSERGSR
ncbi:hypothetical protein C475_05980 [Halosimplex carlsbadense 2-9-1]|uniref:Membrane-bound metal-dependent hydrolase n=1 Tax=Halosimplex carlsbadense 2-9-1 TaxID=797114 RepID=M0CZY2_9EURY|nr:hypothetical protein [Halosimplex carlsbadense]ELZ27444.1 hypothetical protein C475_05980 [Halosimplex carlsbadense 2-9-1]